MRTLRLKQLIDEVLKSIGTPHTEDVIEDVFHAIEQNPMWRKTYDQIVHGLGKGPTIAWAGFWIAHAVQRVGGEPGPATRSEILDSYAKLLSPAPKRSKKVKEPEALKALHDHYLAHRDTLPPNIREHRDVILTLIMDGIPTDVAFSKALEKPTFAR